MKKHTFYCTVIFQGTTTSTSTLFDPLRGKISELCREKFGNCFIALGSIFSSVKKRLDSILLW
jgi:hypothetical protein